MANPRVFVSSTCYDLSEIRDSLDSFIRKYNFEPVMSDKGDVFYNPDIHTHDACLREVETCQLFILIIGGRFGGEYYKDKNSKELSSKSITNREYLTAKKCNIPIFTFVRRSVLENHFVYTDNKKHNPQAKFVYYSSIDKQEYAENIFKFIDEVRKTTENNALFAFDFSREIQEILGKQWAGMFYDFLLERQRKDEEIKTNKLIENLTIVTEKTEELIKKLLTNQLGKEANEFIEDIDKEAEAKKFFNRLFEYFGFSMSIRKQLVNDLQNGDVSKKWYQYLCTSDLFTVIFAAYNINEETSQSIRPSRLVTKFSNKALFINPEDDAQKLIVSSLEQSYNIYKELPKETRARILKTIDM